MAIKFPFPDWVDIKSDHLEKIDAGNKILPLKRSEWNESGVFIRGPIVIEATPRTKQQYRDQFPNIYHFVFLDPESNYEHLKAYLGERPVLFELQRILFSNDEGIFFTAKNVGHLKIRQLTPNDYPGGMGVEEFVKDYWGVQ